ncbi:MAG: glycosyltransferase family 2 protein [bacterium]
MLSVSVVMATYNSERTVEQALRSVREQDYPQDKIEIVVADGGSSDKTRQFLSKYKAKVINERTGSPEKAKALAIKKAKGELVLFLASDNELTSKAWLREMVGCLKKEKQAVAAYSWRYQWRETDTSLNRYFALLGANDPVAWFMGRADRQGWGSKKWKLSGEVKNKGKYFTVKFNEWNMPTLGDNGFLIWREELLRAGIGGKQYFHIDAVYDLVKLGKNLFVVGKSTIEHNTGGRYGSFLAKRGKYMRELYLKVRAKRRYRWDETRRDKVKILGFVIYTLTLVGPIMWSVRGYIWKRDLAWFWHLPMCLGILIVYGWESMLRFRTLT